MRICRRIRPLHSTRSHLQGTSPSRHRLIDELQLHIVPLTLGAGTRLFEGVPPLKLEQVKSRAARLVTHVTYRVLP